MKTNDVTTDSVSREKDLFDPSFRDNPSSRKKKRSGARKTLLWIVGILAVVLAVCLGVLYYAMNRSNAKAGEIYTLETEQYSSYQNEISSLTLPEGWDQSVFEQLKSQALAAYDSSVLDLIAQAEQGDENANVKLAAMDSASAQPLADQYKAFLTNGSQYPASLAALVANDPSLLDFALSYSANAESTGNDVDLEVTDFSVIPDLKTFDANWGYVAYGNGIMADSGSAPTAIAAVFSYIMEDPAITPLRVAQWAAQYGYDLQPVMENDNSIFGAAALTWGINMTPISPYAATINNSLAYGGNVILDIGTEDNPQYVVVQAVDDDGNWIIANPSKNSGTYSVDPESIADQIVAAYSFW
jgi:hypothetical protein